MRRLWAQPRHECGFQSRIAKVRANGNVNLSAPVFRSRFQCLRCGLRFCKSFDPQLRSARPVGQLGLALDPVQRQLRHRRGSDHSSGCRRRCGSRRAGDYVFDQCARAWIAGARRWYCRRVRFSCHPEKRPGVSSKFLCAPDCQAQSRRFCTGIETTKVVRTTRSYQRWHCSQVGHILLAIHPGHFTFGLQSNRVGHARIGDLLEPAVNVETITV